MEPSAVQLGRRELLFRWANGFGGLALLGLLDKSSAAARSADAIPPPTQRAKSIIFLYMDGGPSHIDTFDPKPKLRELHGKPIPIEIVSRFASKVVMASPFKFRRHGHAGAEVSEVFPEIAKVVDELAIVRSMVAENMEHPTANLFLTTGTAVRGRPSLGSWLTYGLGNGSENLPGYLVLYDNGWPQGGLETFSNGFLPPRFQFTGLNMKLERPVEDVEPGEISGESQRAKLETIARLNGLAAECHGRSPALDAVAENYEMAFRMQSAVPELFDLIGESKATRALYGLDDPRTERFARQCLLARRLVERGVRFINLLPPTVETANRWDLHENIAENLRGNSLLVDKPIAGLLRDLRARGLLDQTLVVWGGEFGRTPTAEINEGVPPGREHNPFGFTMWLAGGGVRAGTVLGQTDEFGYRAIERPVTVHDLHATLLHLCGIDHTRLTFRHAGRDFRLTDVYGKVVQELIG